MASVPARGKFLDRALVAAQVRPGRVIAWVLGLHVVVWTLLPILLGGNLQLDVVEGLALGKEWQLGYFKHPPLPWWLADLSYRLTGEVRAVALLGPLASAACIYVVWRFAREMVDERRALIAALALEGLHFLSISGIKFNHDVLQLPFWALTGWFFYRGVMSGRAGDWLLSGAFLALAFWSKYTAFALAATLGLILLIDPISRRAWRTPGPYLMTAAFLIVLGPNLWWLIESDFQPLRYVEGRAITAAHWYQFLTFPLGWIASQAAFISPALLLIALAYFGASRARPDSDRTALRIVSALAFGPFVIITLLAALLGRTLVASWGYPLWIFATLAAVMWLGPVAGRERLRRFAIVFLVVFAAFPIGYLASELFEPFVRDRAKGTEFPGRLLADTVTRDWRTRTGTPLRYVSGADYGTTGAGEFAANNVAVYSPDRPHVLVHGDPKLSPWIDMADFERRGAVFVWQQRRDEPGMPPALRSAFPRAELQPSLVLPRQTLNPRVRPERIGYAIMPPKP